ncbi:MAG: hypothetical protein RLZ59_1061 [Pseudomonadota bacterium]|jgi:DNA-binding transcriptional LysR family regulator
MVICGVTLSSNAEDGVFQLSECGVQSDEQPTLEELLDRINWDDLNVIRQVAETSSLRKASRDLKMSVNTLRARIDRLELALGTTLFSRSRDGLRVTAEGRTVIRIAKEMRMVGCGLPAAKGNYITNREGELRLAASEGIGTFWLTPRLPELKLALPDHLITLSCSSLQEKVDLENFDIAVSFDKPKDKEAICARLATVHLMLFASDQYIRQHGVPQSIDDIEGHHFIQLDLPDPQSAIINAFLTEEMLRRLVPFRVSSSYSLYSAVVSGAGIAAMPTYARVITRRVRPLDILINLRLDLWLSYKHEARQSVPVRKAINWLKDSFDARRYPWFAPHFIHPNDFLTSHEGSLVVPLFDQMAGDI